MVDTADNTVSRQAGQTRRWFGARGEAAQAALGAVYASVSTALGARLQETFDRIDDALFDRAEISPGADIREQYRNAQAELRNARADVETLFSSLLVRAFEQGVPQDMELPTEIRLHSEDAAGLNQRRVEEDLAVSNMIDKTRRDCAEVLASLDRRMGFLLGDADLECWQNPLGPQALCDMFRHAIDRVDVDLVVRLVIFKTFDQHLIASLPELYRETDMMLLQFGVLPGMQARPVATADVYSVPLASGIVPSELNLPAQDADYTVPMAAGIVPDFNNRDLGMHAANGGCMDDLAASVPMAPGIVPSGPAARLYPDADSVPMAAGIVPSGQRLRPAQQDESVYPLVDDGNEVEAPDTAEYPLQEPEPRSGSSNAPDPAAAESPRDQHLVDRMRAGQNRLDSAEIAAVNAVEARLEDAANLGFVKAFVSGAWKNLLQLICMREGKDSESWKQSVATMDDLVWSVKPKATPQQCERLKIIRERLLSNLRRGMQRLALADSEVDAFTDQLTGVYRELLGEPAPEQECEQPVDAADTAPGADAKQPKPAAPAAESPVAVRPRAAKVLRTEGEDRYVRLVKAMQPGDWLEFLNHKGAATRAKFSWTSPITGTMLFTDRRGLQVGDYSIEELAKLLRFSRARVVSSAASAARSVEAH